MRPEVYLFITFSLGLGTSTWYSLLPGEVSSLKAYVILTCGKGSDS